MQKWASHIVFSCFLMGITLVGCEKEAANCVESRGEQTHESRDLGSFHHIKIDGRIDVEIIDGPESEVAVTYGANAIGGITTEVRGDTLYIAEINSCDWMRKVDPLPLVSIQAPALESVYSMSSGSVQINFLDTLDSFLIEVSDAGGSLMAFINSARIDAVVHTGATDVTLSGVANNTYLYNNGYGPLDASGLISRTVTVHNNNSGDISAAVWETAYTQIYQTGDIFLYGSPEIVRWNTSGSGKVFTIQ